MLYDKKINLVYFLGMKRNPILFGIVIPIFSGQLSNLYKALRQKLVSDNNKMVYPLQQQQFFSFLKVTGLKVCGI